MQFHVGIFHFVCDPGAFLFFSVDQSAARYHFLETGIYLDFEASLAYFFLKLLLGENDSGRNMHLGLGDHQRIGELSSNQGNIPFL